MTRPQGRALERRLTVIEVVKPAPAAPLWSPDPGRVENYRVEIPLLGMGRLVGRQGLDVDSGRLVEFSLSAQVERGATGLRLPVWTLLIRRSTCMSGRKPDFTSTGKYCSLSLDRTRSTR